MHGVRMQGANGHGPACSTHRNRAGHEPQAEGGAPILHFRTVGDSVLEDTANMNHRNKVRVGGPEADLSLSICLEKCRKCSR